MTDDIKVGDRLHSNRKFLVVGRSSRNLEMGWICRDEETGAQGFVSDLIVHTCQRLPPEIGVGDIVRVKVGYGEELRTVEHVCDGRAWLKVDVGPQNHALWLLSALTLVKKAEKD